MSHSMLQFIAYTIHSLVYSLHRATKKPVQKQSFLHTVIIALFETAGQQVPKPDICQLFKIWFPSDQETDQVSVE